MQVPSSSTKKKRWGSRKEKKLPKNKRHSLSVEYSATLDRNASTVEKRRAQTTSLYFNDVVDNEDDEDDYVQVIAAPIIPHTVTSTHSEKTQAATQSSVDADDLVCLPIVKFRPA